jgi:hypothetical protein
VSDVDYKRCEWVRGLPLKRGEVGLSAHSREYGKSFVGKVEDTCRADAGGRARDNNWSAFATSCVVHE